MSCIFCKNGETTFFRRVTLSGDRYSYDFPIRDIVEHGAQVFPDIYKCKTCASLWVIQSRGTGDPRSTYPEFYVQEAKLLEGKEKEIVENPTLDKLLAIRFDEKQILPYGFAVSCLQKIEHDERKTLKKLYMERPIDLDNSIKYWLETWFSENFPEEHKKIAEQGFHDGAVSILTLSKGTQTIESCSIDADRIVLWTAEEEEKHYLSAIEVKTGNVLWKTNILSPFQSGPKVPILFWKAGYVCSLHGVQETPFSLLDRPDKLLVHDLNGKKLGEFLLQFSCYEVDPTKERDYSECRTVHNFDVTIHQDILYLAKDRSIVVYDLLRQKEIRVLDLPNGEIFSGRMLFDDTGNLIPITMKGFCTFDPQFKPLADWKSFAHPVLIDERLNAFYYYAKIENPQRNGLIEFKEKQDSGVELIHFLNAPPLNFDEGYLFCFGYDKTYFTDSEFRIVKIYDKTCTDILGPHKSPNPNLPVFLTENRIVFAEDYKHVTILNRNGEWIAEYPIQSELRKFFTFDGKNIAFVEYVYDGYGAENRFLLTVLGPDGELKRRIFLRTLDGFNICFEAYLTFVYDFKLMRIDLAENPNP
ncbi:hypothetical protein HGB47_07390 [Leptospira yasudae]|uniref:hypothetical protein n=1 Tax=Leptospira yasudae TaxID=2202201 RepID=UPI001C4E3D47|nr:hypothetical protein [Leptospira yasudae]MBW0433437.1 hypothetical protein [Leptospira yasudae]